MTPAEIKSRRRALGMSQAVLAHTLNVRQATVSDWEKGKVAPSPLALVQLETLGDRSGRAVQLVNRGALAIHALVGRHGRDECSPEAFSRVVLESAGIIKPGQYIDELWKDSRDR